MLASSGSVYGECAVDSEGEPVPSRENHPTDAPVAPYAASKRGAELMARAFASNAGGKLPVTVARIFTVYGPRGRPDMAVFRFVRAASTGGTLFRFGDGRSTWRDYTHVDDVVEGLLAALYRDAEKRAAGGDDRPRISAIAVDLRRSPTRRDAHQTRDVDRGGDTRVRWRPKRGGGATWSTGRRGGHVRGREARGGDVGMARRNFPLREATFRRGHGRWTNGPPRRRRGETRRRRERLDETIGMVLFNPCGRPGRVVHGYAFVFEGGL